MDDGAIIRASLRDGAAFGEVFERHFEAVSRYARSRVGEAAGEEIAARTFLIAFEKRHRFDAKATSSRPWLFGIATNLIRHHDRDERIHLAALGRLPHTLVEPDPNDDPARLDAYRLRGVLRDALLGLSAGDRDAFLLNVLGDLTYEEVAAGLGIPVGTVRSRIHHARKALREQIARVVETDGWTADADDGTTSQG